MKRDSYLKQAREQWGLLVGPKSNQFDQETALIKIVDSLLASTQKDMVERCIDEAEQYEMFLENVITGLEMADGSQYKALRLALKSRVPPSKLLLQGLLDKKE